MEECSKAIIEFPYGNDICYRVLFYLSGDILEMFIRGLYSVGEQFSWRPFSGSV